MGELFLIVVSCLIAALRFSIVPQLNQPPFNMTDLYKDFSHLFVGGLFGAWIAKRDWKWFLGWVAIGLSLLELVMLLIQKSQTA